MMNTYALLPGVTLRHYPDGRFKQGCLSVALVRPMCREEAALNALVPSILLRGTEQCPDLRAITHRLDSLYGAAIGPLVRRAGDYQTTGLYCGFIDDRYAMEEDGVLEPLAEFLEELLLRPKRENGIFCRDYVESEKKNLISTIESERNDKRAYAMSRLLKAMGREDSFGIPRLGEAQEVAAITPEAAWSHYQKVLETSPVELFYVGAAPAEQVAALMKKIFAPLARRPMVLPPQTPFHDGGANGELVERMEVAQAKLCMGFTTPIHNRDPRFAAMQVVNTVYGGGMTSKLFMNVREKRSLCYAVGSAYYGSKGVVTVSAGIDGGNYAIAREEILAQLDACRRGEITEAELTAAREALLSTLRATLDSPGAIEGFYATAVLSGLGRTVEEYAREVAAVTVEAAAAAAQTLTLHTTYLLKGVDA